jgi:hypothetical protein
MIEEALLPKNLLRPELRNFAPDFGTRLKRIGFDRNSQWFLGVYDSRTQEQLDR